MGSSLAGICASAVAATNSSFFARVWQTDDGLPNNNIHGMAQTPDGYLWIGTPVGLVRFDGVRFEEIPSSDFIDPPNRGVMAIRVSDAGGLWLQMDRAAVVNLENGKAIVQLPNPGLLDALGETLTEDSNGTLWITYLGGFVCSLTGGTGTMWSDKDHELPWGPVSSAARDTLNRIWLARGGRVGIVEGGKFRAMFRVESVATRIASARAGGIWICSGQKILIYEDGKELREVGVIPTDPTGGDSTAIMEDQQGALWIGTAYNGLFRRAGGRFEKVPTSHPEITSLFEDREGNVWVGTRGGGLNRLRQRAVRLETVETGLPFEAVRSVTEDMDGDIWLAAANGVLVRSTGEGWSTISTNSGWPPGAVTCVAADPRGGIWAGTRSRRLIFAGADGRVESWGRSKGMEATTILTLLVSRNGDVWIGGLNRIMQRFRNGEFQTFQVPEDMRIVRAAAEDASGNIWFGSSRGMLMRVVGDEVRDETALIGGTNSIRCLHATEDGALWIGFAGWGVGRLKDGRFASIDRSHGLYDQYVSQIVSDGIGWIWVGGDRGLFKVRQEELEAVAEGRAARVRSIHYGRGEGLPSLQADFGFVTGAMRSRDGRIWIPTRSALAVIDPQIYGERQEIPPVLLRRVAVDERTVAVYKGAVPVRNAMALTKQGARMQVPPGHRKLEFDFTAPSFSAPENVRFQYWLEGFDVDWIESGTRNAGYSRLPAGNYTFRVKAARGDGDWSDTDAALAFTVAPFAWQTWWFRTAALVLFSTVVVVLVRYVSFRRLQLKVRVLQQETALHKERSRIARDLHDDLGSGLTKIVLLSDLLVDERDTNQQTQNARQISTAAREVIKALDETVWAVSPGNDTLPHLINYAGQFAVEFLRTAGIRCHVELPDRPVDRVVSAEVRHNLFLVLKEALNNVVRHASANEVWLHVVATDEAFTMIIEDNGQGMGQGRPDAFADGLRNMRQRMEEIGGRMTVESRVGSGTKLSFYYPWTGVGG